MVDVYNDWAYVVPLQAWIYRNDGVWQFATPVGRDGITHYLITRGVPGGEVKTLLKDKHYQTVLGAEMLPNAPAMVTDATGGMWINLWVPPTLRAEPGEYPRIEAILNWLCADEPEAVEWLCHWLALKVQNPTLVPKVAVVFSTEPGAGKGTLFRIIEEMLGPDNCVNVSRGSLESRFNAMWARKLMVLADEVMSNENQKDISDRLKILIDSRHIELEGKGKDQQYIRNRLAWVFASNDTITPVKVEKHDRRYTVFSNHDPLTSEYRQMTLNCYERDRVRMTESFVAEVRAFYYDLLNLQVDQGLVSLPYENDARDTLIEANHSAHETFLREVDENGVDVLVEELINNGDWRLSNTREAWDFAVDGVATQVIYDCYVYWAKKTGARPLKLNKFGSAVKNHRPAWTHKKNTAPNGRRVNCYVVKRSPNTQKAVA